MPISDGRKSPTWLTEKNWKANYDRILVMDAQGLPHSVIARNLRLSGGTVYSVTKATLYQQKLDTLRINMGLSPEIKEKVIKSQEVLLGGDVVTEACYILSRSATLAANTMVKLAQSGTPEDRVKLLACQDILNRTGCLPTRFTVEQERIVPPKEIETAKRTLLETASIIKRLETKSSAYVIDRSNIRTMSSDTDKGSDGNASPDKPTDA